MKDKKSLWQINISLVLFLAIGLIFSCPGVQAIDELKISDIQTFEVTGNSAKISWKTNRLADGLVEFGKNTNYTNYIKQAGPSTQYHEVTLGGLKQQTKYYLRIKSIDAYGQEIISFGHSFKTGKTIDDTPPVISNVRLQYVTDTTAVISWQTNEYATTLVYYSYQSDKAGYKWSKKGSSGTDHVVIIKSLKPMTYYKFEVRSQDKSKNWAYGGNGKFSTTEKSNAEATKLKILNLKPIAPGDTPITHDTAIIEWQVNKLATGTVSYGTSERYKKKMSASGYDTNFKLQLRDLQPSTTYHYQVSSKDIFGKSAVSNDMTFVTSPAPEKLPELKLAEVKQAVSQYDYSRSIGLYKTASDPRVYAIFGNHKHHISSPAIFLEYGYDWAEIETVSQEKLNSYSPARLVKTPESSTIYYLYLEKSIRKPINNPSVFNSYALNKWEDVVTIPQSDLSRFKEVHLVKTKLSPTVYYLENNIKKPVKNVAAFEKNGFRWGDVCMINQADMDSYYAGDFLE